MGKKIRFPLKLSEGAEVRTLEELREHFDLEAILEYYKNGKLLTWLEDRYLEGEAEAVQALDTTAPDFQRRLCEVFQVEYAGATVDLEAIERRQERLKRLRSITDEAEYIQNIDRVAFDQEDLADLLDEGEERIYLCGEHFTVPASRKGITYVGINNPAVHISGKMPEDAAELRIEFTGVSCNDSLQQKEIFSREEILIYPQRDELPQDLLRDVCAFEIDYVFMTENYYFYRRITDEKHVWCRYEIANGQEIILKSEIASLFEKKLDLKSLDRVGDAFSISEDVVAFCRYEGHLCSIDMASMTVLDYDGIYAFGEQYAFSQKYFATFYVNTFSNEELIEVYTRSKSQRMVHKIKAERKEGIFFDGEKIDQRFDSMCYPRECDLIKNLGLYGDKVCFVVYPRRFSDLKGEWLACIDFNSGEYKVFKMPRATNRIIARSGDSVYTLSSDYDLGLHAHISEFFTIDLCDGTIKKVFQWYTGPENPILRTTDKYIICEEKKQDGMADLFLLELVTGKIKKIPFLHSHDVDKRCLMLKDTLYCFNYKKWHGFCNRVQGVNCKFDLSADSPELIELEI